MRSAAGECACVRARGPSSRSGTCMENVVLQYAHPVTIVPALDQVHAWKMQCGNTQCPSCYNCASFRSSTCIENDVRQYAMCILLQLENDVRQYAHPVTIVPALDQVHA
jgi:hypothetical protein